MPLQMNITPNQTESTRLNLSQKSVTDDKNVL